MFKKLNFLHNNVKNKKLNFINIQYIKVKRQQTNSTINGQHNK